MVEEIDKQIQSYRNLVINSNAEFVSYILMFTDGTETKARKEWGKSYGISLTKIENFAERKIAAKTLLKLVQDDIEDGINPKFKQILQDRKTLHMLQAAQAKADECISFDKALDMLKKAKGWINPVEGKEASSNAIPTMLRTSFKPYLQQIGKADDIREVKRIDIKNFIESRFNPADGSQGWSSSSCSAAKARISILFGVLIEHDLLESNPTLNVKIKSDSEKIVAKDEDDEIDRFEPWTNEEVNTWLESLRLPVPELLKMKESTLQTIYAASNIIHYSFIRKSELLRLRCWMVDLENERFTIPPKITKSARKIKSKNLIHVDMPDPLVVALKAYIKYKFPNGCQPDDYLFFKDRPSIPLVYITFTKHHTEIRDILQRKFVHLFENKNFYALKHTGVIKLFNALVKTRRSPAEIQAIIKNQCRHASFTQTETYLRDLKLEFTELREKVTF